MARYIFFKLNLTYRYKWIKNGKDFKYQTYDDRISQQPGRGTLVIKAPREEDIGNVYYIGSFLYLIQCFGFRFTPLCLNFRSVSMFRRKRIWNSDIELGIFAKSRIERIQGRASQYTDR